VLEEKATAAIRRARFDGLRRFATEDIVGAKGDGGKLHL
jgi:hypothetical protein